MKLSIIIPTLNEAHFLQKTLLQIQEMSSNMDEIEVLVVDSGSSDETVAIAKKSGWVHILEYPQLKGKKYAILNQGADKAVGDTLLFLDADTLLPRNYDLEISRAINEGYLGGAFEFKLDGGRWGLRVIEWANRARYRLGQKYYGDQGVFCTKEAFSKVGGYPSRLILESAHFCAKLKHLGKLKLIRLHVITSSRRFERSKFGPLWVLTIDTWIFLLDKLGFKNNRFGKYYWSVNDR